MTALIICLAIMGVVLFVNGHDFSFRIFRYRVTIILTDLAISITVSREQ